MTRLSYLKVKNFIRLTQIRVKWLHFDVTVTNRRRVDRFFFSCIILQFATHLPSHPLTVLKRFVKIKFLFCMNWHKKEQEGIFIVTLSSVWFSVTCWRDPKGGHFLEFLSSFHSLGLEAHTCVPFLGDWSKHVRHFRLQTSLTTQVTVCFTYRIYTRWFELNRQWHEMVAQTFEQL